MPIKREETTHGLITREVVSITSTEEEPATPEEWEEFAAAMREESGEQRLKNLEQSARDTLAAAGLPTEYGFPLRNAVADRLHSPEWYAAEVLRHMQYIHNSLKSGDTWGAIDTGVYLGVSVMMRAMKHGVEGDALLGRADRQGRSDGGRQTAEMKKEIAEIAARELLTRLAKLRESDHVTTDRQAANIIATQDGTSLEAIERRVSRARKRLAEKTTDTR